jgi:hypothetical protein
MSLEIALVLTFTVILTAFTGVVGLTLLRLLRVLSTHSQAQIAASAQMQAQPQAQAFVHPPTPMAAPWSPGAGEDSQPTLLPITTPLPPYGGYAPSDRSEDEDDVPTTLYRTDDDGEIALLTDADD